MGIVDSIKDVAKTVRQIDNIDLYKQILDLQSDAMKLEEEKAELKREIQSLKEKLTIKKSLIFEKNMYWDKKEDGSKEGPFCPACWDGKEKLVRMKIEEDDVCARCTICGLAIRIKESGKEFGSLSA